MARELGFEGECPPLYLPVPSDRRPCPTDAVAIGIGYLKHYDKRWDEKHWGNEQFIELCQILIERGLNPILIGDSADRVDSEIIVDGVGDARLTDTCGELELADVFGLVSQCEAYVGNDTGNMHAAAACDIRTLGIFKITNAVKNTPWCKTGAALQDPSVGEVSRQLESWGILDRA